LLQEADTTSEWDAPTVAKFLSLRSVPAPTIATPTVVTTPRAGIRPPSPPITTAAPLEAARLQTIAMTFTDTLAEGDIKSLLAYWSTQRGVPPEFDGRLLAKSRAELGRDLDMDEKRFVRVQFSDAVKLKAAP
jgi:hypothetical protein